MDRIETFIKENGDMSLVNAARYGRLDIVKYLIEEKKVHYIQAALKWAAAGGHLDVVKYLISKGADVCSEKDNITLKWAIYEGKTEIVDYLIKQGADVITEGDHLLADAAALEKTEILELLLKHTTDPKSKNRALYEAALNNKREAVKILLKHGADAKNIDYKALINSIHTDIIYLLWSQLPHEDILPFLVSDDRRIREMAETYLLIRGAISL